MSDRRGEALTVGMNRQTIRVASLNGLPEGLRAV